jgi:hypothetical protein
MIENDLHKVVNIYRAREQTSVVSVSGALVRRSQWKVLAYKY